MQAHMNPLMTLPQLTSGLDASKISQRNVFKWSLTARRHPPSQLQPLSVEEGLRHVPTVQKESAKSHPQPHYLPSCFEPGKVQCLTQLSFMQAYPRWLRSTSLPLPQCQLIFLWPSTIHCILSPLVFIQTLCCGMTLKYEST